MLRKIAWAGVLLLAAGSPALSMPREDVIDVPAMGEGLCVHNLFQSYMVLQRDKPISVWGWAAPGERVTVSLAEAEASSVAAADRSWKVTLPAMGASWATATSGSSFT